MLLQSALLIAPLVASSQDGLEVAPTVGFELLADVSHVRPGATFHLAARLTMPPHWHVYWENPGDSGLATRLEITAPEGVQVGEVRFPGPERYELPGELVVYGYEKELVLFVPVTVPMDAPTDRPLSFRADASWLVCKVACFMGDGTAELAIPWAETAGDVQPANEKKLAAQRALLPRSASELSGLRHEWLPRDGKHEYRVQLSVPDGDLSFFPDVDAPLELTVARGDGSSLTLDYESKHGDEAPAVAARGLLRVERDGAVRYFAVDLAKTR